MVVAVKLLVEMDVVVVVFGVDLIVNGDVVEDILTSELKIVSLLDQIILESLRVQRLSVMHDRRYREGIIKFT